MMIKKTLFLQQVSAPRITNIAIAGVLLYLFFNLSVWKHEKSVICWDVISYFAYLPATFVHGDLTLKFMDKDPATYGDKFWPETGPNGSKVIKTTMGMSFLYAPFFFLGYLIAKVGGYPVDGFSMPYRFFIQLSSIFYLLVGLYFLRKVLQPWFKPLVTSLVLVAVATATNLLHYVYIEAAMSHAYSFCLFSIFIFLTIKWYENNKWAYTIYLGLLTGLISMIRPTNAIIVLFFIFYDVQSFADVKNRGFFFARTYIKILVMMLFFFLIWLPQFFYWKTVTGEWFFYSYNTESFFFGHPQLLKGLFGFRKGWFVYTPVMFFAVFFGIPMLYKKAKGFFVPILLFTLINIYVVLSWWCWWYGGGFGQRAFIESYSLLAIPLAVFISWLMERKTTWKYVWMFVILLFIAHGIFQNAQYQRGSIHWDSMTREAYFDSFGRIKPSERFQSLLKTPNYERAKLGLPEGE